VLPGARVWARLVGAWCGVWRGGAGRLCGRPWTTRDAGRVAVAAIPAHARQQRAGVLCVRVHTPRHPPPPPHTHTHTNDRDTDHEPRQAPRRRRHAWHW
jgi:hypothetical protein